MRPFGSSRFAVATRNGAHDEVRPENEAPSLLQADGLDVEENRLLGGVHSVKLENVFRRIHANSANLFHGRPPLSEIYSDLILARLMPSGAVHTNRPTPLAATTSCT